MSAATTARRAEALGSRLPPLMVAAERVAATVAQGVHGRRRVGQGDSFWQFRHYVTGDATGRIDWRQSAKSGRPAPDGWFVRETEWEAAQTVCLWRDVSASMRWRSRAAAVEKADRAELLLLALASLLLRGGERVLHIKEGARPVAGKTGLDQLAMAMAVTRDAESEDAGMPPHIRLPRHANVVLFGDFLGPIEEIEATIARFAALPARGYLLQVLDPAEVDLPYHGRVRFRGLEHEGETLLPRVETVRAAYGDRLRTRQEDLGRLCAAAGFGFGVHRTDQPPGMALLALYTGLGVR